MGRCNNKYMKDNISRRKRISFLINSVALSLFFILITMAQFLPQYTITATASSGPSIHFLEDSWDFGDITPDELPTHIFKFENRGDEVLIIKGIKVSCKPCIDPVISTKELNPGEEGELKITVNSLDMIGQFSKRIYVKSNDPDHPQIVITVSGFIKEKNESTSTLSSPSSETTTPFMIGKSYFNQREYDKAIIEFEKSIELDSNHTDSYYYLGQCYLQKGIIEYNNKHILKAYSLYRKAHKISEQAINQYEKKIEKNPVDLDAYIKLGYIYEIRSLIPFINEYDKSLNYFFKALEIFPENAWVHLNIGFIYLQKKDYPQAIEYLEKAAKMSSHNIEVYYYLGLSYNKIGEKEKALTLFSRVIELAPQSEFAQEAEKELKKINK